MSVQTILPSAKKLMLLLALAFTQLQAQDLAHYKRVIKEISSAKYQGRGYAKGGANKTGKYLQKEYQKKAAYYSCRDTQSCKQASIFYRAASESIHGDLLQDCYKNI